MPLRKKELELFSSKLIYEVINFSAICLSFKFWFYLLIKSHKNEAKKIWIVKHKEIFQV